MITRYYLFHPQLKFFCGKKDAKYWSSDSNAVRLFARKCDATNCKVQTDSYWELEDAIVMEVSFEL